MRRRQEFESNTERSGPSLRWLALQEEGADTGASAAYRDALFATMAEIQPVEICGDAGDVSAHFMISALSVRSFGG